MLKKLLTTKKILFVAMMLVAGINTWGQISVANTTALTQNFDAMGTSQTASLPSNWKMSAAGATAPTWAASGNFTATNQAASSGSPNTGGRYNFGNGTTTSDRAIGFISSGSYASPNSIMAHFRNTNTASLNKLTISYDAERYRQNSAAAQIDFYYSTNGTTWTAVAAGNVAASLFPTGTSTYGFPLNTINVAAFEITGLSIATNSDFYLRWNINTSGGNSQAITIDNVSVTAAFAASAPTLTTNTVGTVTTSTAVLNGTANANGAATLALYFDYGTTTSYGSQVTATTPSSASGSSNTSFTGTATGLSPNTTYNYRASGDNGTVYNGSNTTFVTLANVPGAPVVGNATTTSLSVTLNATTQNSNPAATQYAIQVTNTNQYVQANGTLGASAVWQTAATWGTIAVTGLTSNTQYTFQVKARNGATTPVETAFGPTASGTTLTNVSPVLSAGTITTFGSVCINTTATPDKSFILDGDNLTGDVTVGPLSGFTFSTTSNGTFTSSLTLTPVSGEVLTDVYVRFTPTAVQSYNGNIVISGGGASSINVAAAGSGINTAPTVTTASATNILGTSARLGGNVTAAGCSTVTTRGVVYATTANPAIGGAGVTNAPASAGGTGAFTVDVSGLTGSTTYYVRAYATNAGGTSYGSEVQFTTLCTVPTNVTAIVSTPGTAQVALSWTNGSCSDEVLIVAKAASAVTATPTGDGTVYTADALFGNGTQIATGEYVVYKGTGTSVTVLGLTNNTTYHFRIFTRRGTTWSSGTTDSETPVITYCTAGVTNIGASDEYISSVDFNGTVKTSASTGYADYTSTSFAVSQYETYSFTVTLTNGFSGDKLLVFADWNHDGDFDDSGETVTLSSSTGVGPYSNTITIPGSAVAGTTRLRIRVYDADVNTGTVTACGTTSYGEVEDYTLNISTGVPTLIAPVATAATLVSPTTFTANWGEVAGAAGYLLDVYTQTTVVLAGWTFPNNPDNATADEGVSANTSKTITTTGSTSAVSYGTQGIATQAASASTWAIGKAWQIEVSTSGYSGISVTSAQRSSDTGPRNFKLQYRIGAGGAWTDVSDANIVVGNNWTSGLLSVELPSACDNKSSLYLRWIVTTSTSADGGSIGSGGTSRIDNIYVRYNDINYLPGYENYATTALSHDVTGLTPSTTYNYRVNAVGQPGVSNNSGHSNAIAVNTGTINIWDNGAWSLVAPPTSIDNALIQDNYSTDSNGTLSVANLVITDGTFTASSFDVVVVSKAISVSATGAMVVENDAYVLQRDDNASNSGSISVNRKGPALKRLDYKMWSSPVISQGLGTFSPLTESNRFYIYNTNTDQYNGIANTSSFSTGAGYLIRMPNGLSVPGYNAGTTAHAWQGTFNGVPHTGEIEVPVTYNAVQTAQNPGEGYNAIGNPYMSPISAGDFYEANQSKIDGTFYFWRKTNGTAEAAYIAYTPGLGGTGSGDDAIQVGQGFIVNVTSNVGTLTFNNAMRVVNFSANNYRMPIAVNEMPAETEKHRYWLKLSNTAGVDSKVLVGYVGNATTGIDNGIDGKLLADNAAVLYTLADAVSLMIQGRPLPFATNDVVPIGYKVLVAGSYTISLENFDGLFADGQNIYLKDKVSNTVHNLNTSAYTFVSEIGTFNDRFEIVYVTDGALGTDNPALTADNIVVFKDGNALNIAAGTTEIASVAIYDIRGRLLYQNNAVNATETSVTALQAAQQVLVVQVTTAQNVKISKKVVY
jgi:trimeric autotransporter adhesin